jgi:hypothetical protein
VVIRSAPNGNGTMQITLSAGTATSGINRLREVRFGAGANAMIDVGTRAEAGNFAVSLPAGTSNYSFTIRRTSNGKAVTVPLTVVDSCGEWKTLVGGGAGAF